MGFSQVPDELMRVVPVAEGDNEPSVATVAIADSIKVETRVVRNESVIEHLFC